MKWLNSLPTTNLRIVITMALAIGTAVRYWVGGWEPSIDWLGFLAVLGGLDVAQFHSKRSTAWKPSSPQAGDAPVCP